MQIGDLEPDGDLDIVVSRRVEHLTYALLNDGVGGFADMDNDGDLDLIPASSTGIRNDMNAEARPDGVESCDGVDNDCDGVIEEGTPDADGDGVCDDLDLCAGEDANGDADFDGDGVPDACDPCPVDSPDDAHEDGVCDSLVSDECQGDPLTGDSDRDGICDDMDACVGADGSGDGCTQAPGRAAGWLPLSLLALLGLRRRRR